MELARLYTALGDPDKAFNILNESLDKHDVLLTNLKEDPGFEKLHSGSAMEADPSAAELS